MKKTKITTNNWPAKREIEEIIKVTSAPDYPYVNYILPKNANPTEQAKYNLCQNIINYQRKHNLPETEIKQRLGISQKKLIDVLFSKIYNLNLEELITYTDNLQIPFEVKITNRKELRV